MEKSFVENLVVLQLFKKFPLLHGTRKNITFSTWTSHVCLL